MKNYYIYAPIFLNTTCVDANLTTSRTFSDVYIIALYRQEIGNFRSFQRNQQFSIYFNYDKTRTYTFPPSFLHQGLIHFCDEFLENIFLQTSMWLTPITKTSLVNF